MKRITIAAFAAFFALPAAAHDYKAGGLVVNHPMAFETPKAASTGGGYLTITNTGEAADRLVAVQAEGFDEVSLHESSTDDMGVARMRHVPGIDLPPGETVSLEPGGYHVMFMGLNGDPFEVPVELRPTLQFEQAGPLDVTFNVESRRDGGHGEMDHSAHGAHD